MKVFFKKMFLLFFALDTVIGCGWFRWCRNKAVSDLASKKRKLNAIKNCLVDEIENSLYGYIERDYKQSTLLLGLLEKTKIHGSSVHPVCVYIYEEHLECFIDLERQFFEAYSLIKESEISYPNSQCHSYDVDQLKAENFFLCSNVFLRSIERLCTKILELIKLLDEWEADEGEIEKIIDGFKKAHTEFGESIKIMLEWTVEVTEANYLAISNVLEIINYRKTHKNSKELLGSWDEDQPSTSTSVPAYSYKALLSLNLGKALEQMYNLYPNNLFWKKLGIKPGSLKEFYKLTKRYQPKKLDTFRVQHFKLENPNDHAFVLYKKHRKDVYSYFYKTSDLWKSSEKGFSLMTFHPSFNKAEKAYEYVYSGKGPLPTGAAFRDTKENPQRTFQNLLNSPQATCVPRSRSLREERTDKPEEFIELLPKNAKKDQDKL